VAWAEYQERLPTKKEIKRWWSRWPDAGIAIITGRVSGIVVIDFDIKRGADPDELLEEYPTQLLVRTGGGGLHAYYRYPEGDVEVGNSVGEDGIDVRADGGLVVAPPSVHESGSIYQWLTDDEGVKPGEPPLAFLEERSSTTALVEFEEHWLVDVLAGVEEGRRNDSCARLAGYYFGKGIPTDVVIQHLRQWNTKNRPPRTGPTIDTETSESETQAQILLRLAAEIELFHTPDPEAFASVRVEDRLETWRVRSSNFKRWLYRQFYELARKPPQPTAVNAALEMLEARALIDGPERAVSVRVAGTEDAIYIDLVDRDWQVVEITSTAWRVTRAAPVRFRRERGMLSLPVPTKGGKLEQLKPFVNLEGQDDWVLLVSFLLAALRPAGPYPILVIQGEQGSAKSTLARVIRSLVDPSTAPLRSAPTDERDLMIAATGSWLLSFDNLSRIREWFSDALCRLATGAGLSTRELYTDAGQIIFNSQRPILVNGIEELAVRQDFRDRAVILILPTLSREKRRDEGTFRKELDGKLPEIFGAVCDALSVGLRNLPDVDLKVLPRMADFAKWGEAVEETLGKPGSFLRAYDRNRREAIELSVEFDPVARMVRQLAIDEQEWRGTATRLLELLHARQDPATVRSRGFPTTPMHLSGRIRRAAADLREMGVEVEFVRKGDRPRTRTVVIRHAPRDVVRSVRNVRRRGGKRSRGGRSADDDEQKRPKKRPRPKPMTGRLWPVDGGR
jgi:hypothetical protein